MKRSCDQMEVDKKHVTEDQSTPKSLSDSDSLQREIESHPDYQHELKLILKVQQKRFYEAERNRNMQIKNVHALYAFEVESIEAGMKFACAEVQAEVRQIILQEREEEAARQLQEEAKRAALAQAQLAAQEQSTTTSNQNSSLECIPEDGHSSRHRTRSLSIASDTGAEQSNTSFEDTLVDLRKKATLSDKRPPITAAVVAGMPTVLLNRKQNNGNKKSKIFGEDILQNVLSEEDVRADFLHIVHHLEDRAMAILNTEKEPRQTVTADVSEGTLTLCAPPLSQQHHILHLPPHATATTDPTQSLHTTPSSSASASSVHNSMQYRAGSLVVVRSSTSAEDLSGTITVISAEKDDVVVRMHTGPRLRVPLAQVRCGRVTIARDVDAYRDMALIMAARSQYVECDSNSGGSGGGVGVGGGGGRLKA